MGGCADGIPASQRAKQQQQGRNGKSQVEQAESGLLLQLEDRHGGVTDLREIRTKNVNLRQNEAAVDLKVSIHYGNAKHRCVTQIASIVYLRLSFIALSSSFYAHHSHVCSCIVF